MVQETATTLSETSRLRAFRHIGQRRVSHIREAMQEKHCKDTNSGSTFNTSVACNILSGSVSVHQGHDKLSQSRIHSPKIGSTSSSELDRTEGISNARGGESRGIQFRASVCRLRFATICELVKCCLHVADTFQNMHGECHTSIRPRQNARRELENAFTIFELQSTHWHSLDPCYEVRIFTRKLDA